MYYFSKSNTRGIYSIGPEGREKLVAMTATGAQPWDIAYLLNVGLSAEENVASLRAKIVELECQLVLFNKVRPYLDGLATAIWRGPQA